MSLFWILKNSSLGSKNVAGESATQRAPQRNPLTKEIQMGALRWIADALMVVGKACIAGAGFLYALIKGMEFFVLAV